MSFIQQTRKVLTALVLVLVLTVSTACAGAVQAKQPTLPGANSSIAYPQLERGNTAVGQDYGTWAVEKAKGLIKDAYVRDNNKLGVVISSQVRPNEVKPLAKSLLEGFHKNFPNQDVKVLMYAPDKKLILTADYDNQSKQILYK